MEHFNQNKFYEKSIYVKLRAYENGDNLIRRFKKKVLKSGILKEVQDRMYFEKPSTKKRIKRNRAIKAIKYEQELN